TYDPETKSGSGFTGRKVKGTIHWVDATHNIPADFHLYEPLLIENEETEGLPFLERINKNSEEVVQGFVEENMKDVQAHDKFQFFRHGYFNVDPKRTKDGKLSFNRIVSLKSSFRI
ncbi:MAG: glutamine--tRNA ligase, partial [Turicibacter sp.]